MIKLRTIIIIVIIYVIAYLSITFDINVLYPYYLFKDVLLYPVHALTTNTEISISNSFHDSVINSLKDEINELKEINGIKTVLSDFNYINSSVIERNREYWFNTITIDKGKRNGIEEDMAVVDSNGLIGRVESVREFTSDVKLITTNDVTNKISVVIKNKEEDVYGILNGYDSKLDLLKIIINKKIDIYDGMKVETTGMGGVYPKGILIGEVFDMIMGDDEVTTIVRVRPSSKIEGERYVSVLQRKEILDN